VELTHQTLMQILSQEGVELIQAIGHPFDPAWHEAVGTVPHQKVEIEPGMVAVVVREGYRLGDRLLRPARVIVTD
jgi:molecular chaperone GrpE